MQSRAKNSPEPPKVMTWPKASKTLIWAGLFDALRYMFLFFWFFGPALAGLYCISKAENVAVVGGLLAKACGIGAVAAGFAAYPITIAFGTVMAIAVGFLGWLTITLIIFITDSRTFKENPLSVLWILEGLGASVFIMAWGVYRKQIKTEKAAYAKWEKENAEALKQEQAQQAAMKTRQIQDVIQTQEAEEAQFAEEEAANEAEFEATQDAQSHGGEGGGSSGEVNSVNSSQRPPAQVPGSNETQFDTLEDPLLKLVRERNRTTNQTRTLVRARQIMRNVSIDPTEMSNPVLRAAYERASNGQKVSDGTEATRGGFVFDNLPEFRGRTTANTTPSNKEKSPEEQRKAA